MIKLSIITAIYNVAQYLPKCLDSLIFQSLKEIEIICVNDGSPDNSLAILKEYQEKDPRIVIIDQKNQGLGAARNNAMKIARGEYIGFVDSDDWVDLDYFAKLYEAAKMADADIAVAGILKHKKHYNRYNLFYKKQSIVSDKMAKFRLCSDRKHSFFNCWNKIYRASLIRDQQIVFSENMAFEDVAFSVRAIFYAKNIVSVHDTFYHYRERADSITRAKDIDGQKKKDHIKAFTDLIKFAHDHDIELPERLNYYESFCRTPFFKIYRGPYRFKILLFKLIPIFKKH